MTRGRFVHVLCRSCEAEFEVEFDPPDAPTLRGRIAFIRRPEATTRP